MPKKARGKRRMHAFSKAFTLEITGLKNEPWTDIYHRLLAAPWWQIIVLVALFFFTSHLSFAGLYMLDPTSIESPNPGTFRDAFFFSVQTMATIGYGRMVPANTYGDVLVSIEALYGLITLTMITGLMFAKFARPTARVLFSKVALITQREGHLVFMFRMANARANQIVEAHLNGVLAHDDISHDGEKIRRLHELKFERQHSPTFALSWSAVHRVGEHSPMRLGAASGVREADEAWWRKHHAEVIVSVVGLDETFGQTVHARHVYSVEEVIWNRRFTDIIREEDGGRIIDYADFHETGPLRSE